MFHKPYNTIRSILVHPKDNTIRDKAGVIYRIKCHDCDKTYVGETDRSLHRRVSEHMAVNRSSLTAMAEHCKTLNHSFDWDSISIIGRENNTLKRKIYEALQIRHLHPAINRDTGYELPSSYEPIISRDAQSGQSRDH